jgi:hypothetical protein
MSPSIVDRSPDLRRLHAERYDLRISKTGGHLIVDHVPYVTPDRGVAYGTLISTLEQSGDHTANPVSDHSLYFEGELPCDRYGQPLRTMLISDGSAQQLEPELIVHHRFSCKPTGDGNYPDYYEKLMAYVAMLLTHALAIDPSADPRRAHAVVLEDDDPDAPFVYSDTASARAEISAISDKLRIGRLAIVGLGGTGSYILDFVAKTPAHEIHLFDGDDFLNHNAFRAPGAATIDDLNAQQKKVDYLAQRYSAMKRRVIPHPYDVDETTVEELRAMQFVFLAADGGEVKRLAIEKLEEYQVPFIDVGISLVKDEASLGGMVLVTTSTPDRRDHVRRYVDMSSARPEELYDGNIQVADLNALNAVMAVIKWKKYCGFYRDLAGEHFSAYTIDHNQLDNAERTWRAA